MVEPVKKVPRNIQNEFDPGGGSENEDYWQHYDNDPPVDRQYWSAPFDVSCRFCGASK